MMDYLRKTIRDTIISLLVILILFYIYVYFNHISNFTFIMKLIKAIIILGVLYFLLCLDYTKIKTKTSKNIKKKLLVFSLVCIFYLFFLNWCFQTLFFDDFVFFILLLYIPISYIFDLRSKNTMIISSILLLFCIITLFHPNKDITERIATYVYFFLIISLILMMLELQIRKLKSNSDIK